MRRWIIIWSPESRSTIRYFPRRRAAVGRARDGYCPVVERDRDVAGDLLGEFALRPLEREREVRVRDDGLLEVRQRQIRVLDAPALQALVNGPHC